MLTEKHVVPLPNGLKIYVERNVFDPAFDTAILVNGALATTASFGQTVQYLGERLNSICFDLPYAGQSRQHNPRCAVLTKDDEVAILQHLADRFAPEYLVSVSWGGVASLFALARGCPSVRRAAICSFSPFLNDAMVDYVTRARDHIAAGENLKAAQLLNDTVGRYLPRIMKLYNYRYLTRLPRDEQNQVAFHVDQILSLQPERYLSEFSNIRCELKFINGALDEYTTPADVRKLAAHVPRAQFATIPAAGHFLDIEGRAQRDSTRNELLGFFCEPAPVAASAPLGIAPACLSASIPASISVPIPALSS
ncbi:alpha/beta hydrolase [Burkholderia sp. Bp8963]|uniref:alpha/beta fold hydrolase n=1 Tax=Burkholderia sp. Bp8963 TaxID=2184547 RepID=UPI000F59F36E|nr:alpha/beta hydrolase [Burkholderia sp. Bp8963]RQS66858.1 alpha/beta hydrolase [Burkholderia sp. Bp8963]